MTATVNLAKPGTLNVLHARRGSRWRLPLTIADDNGDPIDLSDAELVCHIKRADGDDAAVVLDLGADIDRTNDTVGVLVIDRDADNTTTISARRYTWELEITSVVNGWDGLPLVRGVWQVSERVAERDA